MSWTCKNTAKNYTKNIFFNILSTICFSFFSRRTRRQRRNNLPQSNLREFKDYLKNLSRGSAVD